MFMNFVPSTLNGPLYACDEIVVLIERRWSGQLMPLPVRCWISSAGALRPKLMTPDAGERTCLYVTARTRVFWTVEMAGAESALKNNDWRQGVVKTR
jgi:hypothetical protein